MFRKKCKKPGHPSKEIAWEKAAQERKPDVLLEVIHCFECGQWHIQEEERKTA